MTHHGPSIAVYSAWDTLRDRCRAMGIPTWRCETTGAIVEEPEEHGLVGLWLRTAALHALVVDAARAWAAGDALTVRAAAPGLWLIPVAHEHRRRRVGLTIAAAFGTDVLAGRLVDDTTATAGLDAAALRTALRRLCRFDAPGVEREAAMLAWMARDLASLVDHEAAVAGFTLELSQCYETIDLLYTLGRSMRNLHAPAEFFQTVFARLHETLPFAWLAARFAADPKALGPLAGHAELRGACSWSPAQLHAAEDQIQARLATDPRTLVVGDGPDLTGEARVIAQPVLVAGKLVGGMYCGDRQGNDPQVSSYDMQLLEAAAAFTGAFLENARLYRDQQAMFMGSLQALTAAIDAKDRYTCGHSERVAYLARTLAKAAGLGDDHAQRVHLSGLLHDVGKIGVPEAVLCKPGRLTDDEFDLIKKHPQIGHDILKGIPMLEDILPGVLHHHERYDGKGYPHGLSGKDIPLVARILGLVDTFDAMSSTRSYRSALPRDKVLAEIQRCAGSQFDPDLAAAFARVDLAEYDAMVGRHAAEYRPVAAIGPSAPPAAAA